MGANKNYRAYHFGNMYLSSIQHGIQAAHAQSEMFALNQEGAFVHKRKTAQNSLWEWANSPTMICLNGGDGSSLESLLQFFLDDKNPYLVSHFNEPSISLGVEVLTNVMIILPEKIWGYNSFVQSVLTDERVTCGQWKEKHGRMTRYEMKLSNKLQQYKLAT